MKFKNNPINQSIFLVFILVMIVLKIDWIFWFIQHFLSAFHSLLLGAILAYLVNITYVFLEKKKVQKTVALVLAYFLIVLVISAGDSFICDHSGSIQFDWIFSEESTGNHSIFG